MHHCLSQCKRYRLRCLSCCLFLQYKALFPLDDFLLLRNLCFSFLLIKWSKETGQPDQPHLLLPSLFQANPPTKRNQTESRHSLLLNCDVYSGMIECSCHSYIGIWWSIFYQHYLLCCYIIPSNNSAVQIRRLNPISLA